MRLPKLLQLLHFALAAAMVFSLVPATELSALSGSEYRVGRIMDDSVFFNGGTLSAAQIQAFLNIKVPTCDTNGSQNSTHSNGSRLYTRAEWGASQGYPAPYTCVKDYSQNVPATAADNYCSGNISGGNKTAAQIIYDVSRACNVNPMVLLVLLQKEQSLITDDWPWSIQYRSATGYGCPDTAACDTTYYGFFNQVYYAGRQFQRYAKLPGNYNHRGRQTSFVRYNPNSSCGGTNVFMENQATAGLYNYTPYQPNSAALNNLYGTGDPCSAYGNRNFWRMFRDWFGSTEGQVNVAIVRHPDGTLVRTLGEPEVYLILGGVRHHISDIETFASHGYTWSDVRIATAGDRQLPTGSNLTFRGGTLIRGSDRPEVYSLRCMPTFCMKDHIASLEVFQGLGLKFSEVLVLAQSRADGIVQDKTITSATVHLQDSLVLDTSTGKVYLVDTNTKRWVPSLQVFTANRFPWPRVRTALPGDLTLPNGSNVDFPEGTLLQASGQPAIYALNTTDAGTLEKRHITSGELFGGFGYAHDQVFVVDASLLPSANGTNLSE